MNEPDDSPSDRTAAAPDPSEGTTEVADDSTRSLRAFFTSLPGILTSLAGLLAAAGVIVGFFVEKDDSSPSTRSVTNKTADATTRGKGGSSDRSLPSPSTTTPATEGSSTYNPPSSAPPRPSGNSGRSTTPPTSPGRRKGGPGGKSVRPPSTTTTPTPTTAGNGAGGPGEKPVSPSPTTPPTSGNGAGGPGGDPVSPPPTSTAPKVEIGQSSAPAGSDGRCSIDPSGVRGDSICGTQYSWITFADGRVHTYIIGLNHEIWNIIEYAPNGPAGETSGWRSLGGWAQIGVYINYGVSAGDLGIWTYGTGSDPKPSCKNFNGTWGNWYGPAAGRPCPR
jgi:hypothetical protein